MLRKKTRDCEGKDVEHMRYGKLSIIMHRRPIG